MHKNIIKLHIKFDEIAKRGWIQSNQKGNGGIGITFESLIGKEIENFEIPDYEGIEIKTKRNYTKHTYITLFNYTPESNFINESQRLKDKYGYPDSILKKCKVLNNSFIVNERKWIGTKYQFILKIDMDKKKLFLYIFDINGKLLEKDSYWSFDTMEEKLLRKMSILAIINADNKKIHGIEYFKYSSISIYTFKGIDTFIKLLQNGLIRVTFKVGVFRTGKRFGQTHDHGTGFEIDEKNIYKLFDIYEL